MCFPMELLKTLKILMLVYLVLVYHVLTSILSNLCVTDDNVYEQKIDLSWHSP